MNRTVLEGLACAALFLGVQFVVLTLAYLDAIRLDSKPLWLHPGLAVAAGFATCSLIKLSRILYRKLRPASPPETRP